MTLYFVFLWQSVTFVSSILVQSYHCDPDSLNVLLVADHYLQIKKLDDSEFRNAFSKGHIRVNCSFLSLFLWLSPGISFSG